MPLSPRAKYWLVSFVITLWLSLSAGAFWYYQWRWNEQFSSLDQLALFDGTEFSALLTRASVPGKISLIHLGRDDCFCNRFNEPHRQAIKAKYEPLGIIFQTLPLPTQLNVATPAVALVSAQGQLAYFGPYSDSLLCSLGDGLVEPLLDQLLLGYLPDVIHTTGVGCFCTQKTE
ncbi:DUF6436 domain-containing protein [Simiduia litorea]|uniref:DUF6436 domain-containing protein n=1 Tax=Simiduia litorea TaxID=1435348 RepID=UPI0036F1A1AF